MLEEPDTNQPTQPITDETQPLDAQSSAQEVVEVPEKTETTDQAAVDESPEESTSNTNTTSDISDLDFLNQFDPHWYVVHTYSGHEKKVSSALQQRVASMRLQDKILEVLVPTQDKIEVRKGKKEQIKEKIFPGYILVRMIVDDYTWLAVRTTPGVTGFVGAGNKPTPIPDEEVRAIQKFMTMEAPKYKTVFSVGEAVKIIEGPFAEFLGTVNNIDEAKGKIKVLVSIFGRETPVELDFMQVSKL